MDEAEGEREDAAKTAEGQESNDKHKKEADDSPTTTPVRSPLRTSSH